jgi:sulfate permease, SulP family
VRQSLLPGSAAGCHNAGVLIIAWVLRLGYVADLISAPVLTGFKIGIGISIAVGQLDSLLGVSHRG